MRLVVRSKIGKKLFYILNHTYGNNASVTSIGSKWPVYFHKSNLVKVGYVNLNRKELKMNEQKTKKELLLDHIAELDKFADQLLMMEEDEDRLNGSNIKESLEMIKNVVEESVL